MNPAIAASGLALLVMLLFVGRRHGRAERATSVPSHPRTYVDPMVAAEEPAPAPAAAEAAPVDAPSAPVLAPAPAPRRAPRVPGRLGVPGEDSDRVLHKRPDPAAYSEQKLLVVGGGDAAVETALSLLSRGNTVALVCFGPDFAGLKANTEVAVRAAVAARRLSVHFSSDVRRFEEGEVVLSFDGPAGRGELRLPVDRSFVIGA
jgi:hypothetical protein